MQRSLRPTGFFVYPTHNSVNLGVDLFINHMLLKCLGTYVKGENWEACEASFDIIGLG